MAAPYTTPLTPEERSTINAAADILLAHTAPGASWGVHGDHWHSPAKINGFTYFSSARTQHTFCEGKTLADKVDWALVQEAADRADSEATRLRKIAELKAKLAELGEAA